MARPKKLTKEVVQKLEWAFARGLNDRLACIYADISTSTLYDYCKKNPEFSERKELLKDTPEMNAKINLAEKIAEGDMELSKYFLERKCKNEFSTKQEVHVSGELNNPFAGLSTDDLKKLIDSG